MHFLRRNLQAAQGDPEEDAMIKKEGERKMSNSTCLCSNFYKQNLLPEAIFREAYSESEV